VTPEIVKAIVDALFTELEKRFTTKPFVEMMITTLHQIALSLLPLILAKAQAKMAEPPDQPSV
jgi:hypothetical protein